MFAVAHLNSDDALFSDALHGLCNELANLPLSIGRDCAHLWDTKQAKLSAYDRAFCMLRSHTSDAHFGSWMQPLQCLWSAHHLGSGMHVQGQC